MLCWRALRVCVTIPDVAASILLSLIRSYFKARLGECITPLLLFITWLTHKRTSRGGYGRQLYPHPSDISAILAGYEASA